MAIIYQDNQAGKICSKCKTWRPIERYRKRLISRDRYEYICRECTNAKGQEWRANHKERVSELNREFYEAHREERKAYHRQYRVGHKSYFDEKIKEFRSDNPDYHRSYMRRWIRKNPEKQTERDNRRRIFKMGKPTSFTAAEWATLKQRYNYTCLRCGKCEPEIKLTADHIVPISKGGVGMIDNIQPLCKPCNTAKHDRTIDYRPSWE